MHDLFVETRMIIDAENSADGAGNRTNRARPTTANGGDVADLVHGSAEAELWERWKNGKSGTPLHLIRLKGVPPIS